MCDRYRHDLVRDWATSLRCDAIFSVFKIGDGVLVQISENKDFSLLALQRFVRFKVTGRQIAADDAPMTGDPNHLPVVVAGILDTSAMISLRFFVHDVNCRISAAQPSPIQQLAIRPIPVKMPKLYSACPER